MFSSHTGVEGMRRAWRHCGMRDYDRKQGHSHERKTPTSSSFIPSHFLTLDPRQPEARKQTEA